jgi:prolipoprotein diacylglyceryltransferase
VVAVLDSGGGGVLGSLLAVPFTLVVAWALRIPASVFWDHLSVGIVAGGFWVRLGCVFNGCCGGRATTGWYGVRLHDVNGVRKRRMPVQFLEMAWWLIAAAGLFWLWPKSIPSGNYALGVLAWLAWAVCGSTRCAKRRTSWPATSASIRWWPPRLRSWRAGVILVRALAS